MEVVAVVGLGYVGLSLAVAFGTQRRTLGLDLSERKLASYRKGIDPAGEVSAARFAAAQALELGSDAAVLAQADYIIIAVPTPVDAARTPDLQALIAASQSVGRHMKQHAVVIYESTVYPGATEEICIPVLEQASGMRWKRDFHVGYSPERINPGDSSHTLSSVCKVVAADDGETLQRVATLYEQVVTAGVHRASSLMVAEAAKVIENTQRDLNIALMNELAIIFDRLQIDTDEVLRAAATKWNFLPFKPGLVGGHCIGVDPYYLTHKAQKLGYHPEVILAGRRINDGMAKFVAERTIKLMVQANLHIRGATVIVLGLTFKEDCPDLRNSKVADLVSELQAYGIEVLVHDPVADPEEAVFEYGIRLQRWNELPVADALICAVAHRSLQQRSMEELCGRVRSDGCLIDLKGQRSAQAMLATGRHVWRM